MPPSREISTPEPDRLSALPPELLLVITRYLPFHSTVSCDEPCCTIFRAHRRFIIQLDVFALSRTCRQLHALFSPEFPCDFLLAQKVDLLEFAVKRGYVGLGKRLLRERVVEGTKEQLVKYVQAKEAPILGERCWWKEDARKQEDARREVVEILVDMGAGRELGKEWHALMGLRWRRERPPSPSQPHPALIRKQRAGRA